MAAEPATSQTSNPPLIITFADAQISAEIQESIEESTFLELAACAFFCGAENQFRKLSQQDFRVSRKHLIEVVMEIANVSESKAVALIDTIQRLAKKYYLIEHIVDQGKAAAEQWLDCQEEEEKPLQSLVNKYRDLTMFDLGVEGVNEEHDLQQQVLYASVDHSVGELRRRTLVILLVIASLVVSVSTALLYL